MQEATPQNISDDGNLFSKQEVTDLNPALKADTDDMNQ